MAKLPDEIIVSIKTSFNQDEYMEKLNIISDMLLDTYSKGSYDDDPEYKETAIKIMELFLKTTVDSGGYVYKPYIAIVDSDNHLICDLALKDPSEPAILMDGYSLVQSDEPMSLIIDEDGKVFLHE